MIARVTRRMRREDTGLSMTELLVSAMLTLAILAMVGTMFVQSTIITTASNDTRNSNGVASNVANAITGVLRMSANLAVANATTPDPAIFAATRSSITVYSLSNTDPRNPAPVMVTFTLDAAGALTELRCVGVASGIYWTFGACASTSSLVIGQGLQAPSASVAPLFTYLDVNNAVLDPGTTSLSLAQRVKVASIRMTVTAQAPGSETEPVVIQNTIVLRNLGLESDS